MSDPFVVAVFLALALCILDELLAALFLGWFLYFVIWGQRA